MLKYVKNGPILISYLKAQIIVLTLKSATPSSNLHNIYESKKMSGQLFRTQEFGPIFLTYPLVRFFINMCGHFYLSGASIGWGFSEGLNVNGVNTPFKDDS